MSDEFQLPDIMDVSPEATQAAEAALDPNVKVPENAREDKDKKTGDSYFRWPENLVIEKAQSSRSASGLTVFFVQAKIRASEGSLADNLGRRVFTRYRLNFRVLNGQEDNPGHEIMNRLSLTAITSLLRATGFLPTDAKTKGITAALLKHVFPNDTDVHDSPIVGKTAIGNLVNRPNKGEGARHPRQTEVETWLPDVTE